MENYQSSTVSWAPLISQSPGANYCGIIGSPQRPDELHNGSVTSRRRPGQQGSRSQKPTVPLSLKMPHEGGQTDEQHSEAIVPLLSTQHSGQTSLSADRSLVEDWCNGGECVQTCHCNMSHIF
ncbi:hypothetical protein VZT92_009035 [Zoarces viviparus]